VSDRDAPETVQKHVIEIALAAWRRRTTYPGFITLWLLVSGAVAYFGRPYLPLDRPPTTPVVAAAIVWAAVNVAAFFGWAWWREPKRFTSDEIGILFAPYVGVDCEQTVRETLVEFRRDLDRRGFTQVLTSEIGPGVVTLRNAQDAHQLLVSTGARLVIYGSVEQGQQNNRRRLGFTRISFSFRHTPLDPQQYRAVAQDSAPWLIGRQFSYFADNSFVEKQILVRNVSEVARYFVALALAISGRLDDALPILRDLRTDIAPNRPGGDELRSTVKKLLEMTLVAKHVDVYHRQVVEAITTEEADEAIGECEKLVREAQRLSPQPDLYGLNLAIFAFHKGDTKAAMKLAKQARRAARPRDPAPVLSIAFLALWDGHFTEALKRYQLSVRCDDWDAQNLLGVVRFMATVFEHHPQKVQVKFAQGFVLDNLVEDHEAARSDYETFLALSDGRAEMKPLRDYAAERLAKLAA
jgi:hypothetical protein